MPYLESIHSFDLIKMTAKGLCEPLVVKHTVTAPSNHHMKLGSIQSPWTDLSISGGYPGLLLLFSELDKNYPEENWDQVVHTYVLTIKDSIENSGFSSYSLFGGLAGTCFVLNHASKVRNRYSKMASSLNKLLLEKTSEKYISPLEEIIKQKLPVRSQLFDLIQGIAGIGCSILYNLDFPGFRESLMKILSILVQIVKPLKIKEYVVPGWYLSCENQLNENDKAKFPNGSFNLGLSHGIPGVLGLCSVALILGIEVDGQKEAIQTIVSWIQQKRKKEKNGYYWNSQISFEEEIGKEKMKNPNTRDAWCYGTPGVARSLFLAGKALHDDNLKKYALESFLSVFSRSRNEWKLPSPTFCHGISGLLIITYLMENDTKDVRFNEKVSYLEKILLEYYNPHIPFGFKDFIPTQTGGYQEIDRAGILEGISGVLLSLLTLKTSSTSWCWPFLINDKK